MHFRCPQGHDWDAERGAATCPSCGAAALTHTLTIPAEVDSDARLRIERAINRFEDEWQNGAAPAFDPYLAEFPNHRDALLAELAQVDLEIRLKRREAARVEEYIARYPRLAEIPGAVVDLLAREIALRQRNGEASAVDDGCRRFPVHAAALRRRLAAPPDPEATGPALRPNSGPRPAVPGYDV